MWFRRKGMKEEKAVGAAAPTRFSDRVIEFRGRDGRLHVAHLPATLKVAVAYVGPDGVQRVIYPPNVRLGPLAPGSFTCRLPDIQIIDINDPEDLKALEED